MDLLKTILAHQLELPQSPGKLPEHRPEMLYFGCVDARLDPIGDIGIPKGKALIHRNIAAQIPTPANSDLSISAALEFFINHIPKPDEGPKYIVVAGHTDCGGLKACRAQHFSAHDHALPLYLNGFDAVRKDVETCMEHEHLNDGQAMRKLEKMSVQQSLDNLLAYPIVMQAILGGQVKVYGWLIDTATRRIDVWDPELRMFEPLTEMSQRNNLLLGSTIQKSAGLK